MQLYADLRKLLDEARHRRSQERVRRVRAAADVHPPGAHRSMTDRLALDLSYRNGRQTGVTTSADLRYLLTKQLSLTAGYNSDFGAGFGLLTRF